jgi:hypothetical protein
VSRGCGHPSSQQKEEPGWRHAFGRCLRTLLRRAATSLGLPLPMSSHCICIAAPLSLGFPMKTTNRTPIAGALTRPGDRNAGNWCRNGSPNLRLELGHQLEPTAMRVTEFAPAIPPQSEPTAASSAPASGYGPPATATAWKTGRFSGQDFPLQPEGTLRCPAGQKLSAQEQRREADGILRVVYAASIRSCRPCPLREQCQWNGKATAKPRQVSVRLASSGGRLLVSPLA